MAFRLPFPFRSLKHVTGAVLAAGLALPSLAYADALVSFLGGIGELGARFNPGSGTVDVNRVNNVNPGGFPWVIERLSADIGTDGRISLDGRGLLLAGGNNIGTNGGQTVHAELFCQGVSAGKSPGVPLDARGDFAIQAMLDQTPPNPCLNPVLLIENTGGAWFAAGIPKR